MNTRLMARAGLAACLFLLGLPAQATVTYSGTEGVGAKVFNGNTQNYPCSSCHPINGRQFDTYANATAQVTSGTYGTQYNDQIANTRIQANEMPATGIPMTAAEKSLISAWAAQRVGATPPPNTALPHITTGSYSAGQYSATLYGTGNGGGLSTDYLFNYGTTTGYGSSSSTTTPSDTGGGTSDTASYNVSISNLNCNTTYHFRARGSNSLGSGTAGSDNSFVTSACPTVTTISDVTVDEDTAVSFTVGSTNKGGGTTVSYALDATSLGRGMTINSSTGAFSWPAASTPDAPTSNTAYSVTVTATYTTSGSSTTTDPDTFQITVTPVNDPPTITTSSATHLSATESAAYSYDVDATDTEGSTLTYSLTTAPAGMTINSGTGVISWTPPEATSNYTANVTVQVSDGGLTDTQSFTITVTANNDAPSITTSSATHTTGTESVAYSYDVDATDPESQTLTYSLTTAPAGMTINSSTGVISWTPPEATSNYTANVTVQVSDGTNNVTQSYTITVTADNDAPSFTSVDVTSAAENSAYSYDVNASDPESQTLTYSLTTNPTGMTINSSTGVISWTPPQAGGSYTANVTVQVGDGTNNVSHSFVITVTASNDPPTFTSTDNTSATEAVAYSYTVTASDPEGGALSYSLTSAPAGMTINGTTGAIAWTPPQALSNYSQGVTVQVSDGSNNVSHSYTITVSADNDAPSFTSTDVTSVAEDNTYSYTVTASDPESQTLTYSLTTKPTGMAINSSTGAISWTPPLNYNGTQSVTVQVSDGTNNVSHSFTVTVTPVNDAPVIATSAVTSSPEDTAYTYDVDATDVDGDTLTYSLTTKPTGMTINSSTGVISWTPPLNYNGTQSVTVQVGDGTTTVNQSYTLTITAVNDTPVITTAAVTADDGSGSYSYDVDASDVDGDTLYYSLVTAPSGMIINSSSGLISWTVPSSVSNPYAVTVKVADRSDNTALTTTQSFSITVQDSDNDTVSDYFDNCPTNSNTDQANNDNDSLGDVCDPDDDNDGIPDTVEVANGLNPFDASDANGDLNNNGISNLDEYNANCGGDAQCYLLSNPVITTSGDQTVDATGYFTPVTVTATATGVSGPITVTADDDGPYRPGVHTVTWSAPWTSADGSSHVATTTQTVTVKPLATMGGSDVAGVGQIVYVPVHLNGTAPTYPVTLDFSISGATEGVDFTVPAHSVQFSSGETLQSVPVTLLNNGVGPDKDLVLTLTGVTGDAVLAGTAQLSHTIRITSLPAAPVILALTVSQNSEMRQLVYGDDGTVTIDAVVSDPNGTTPTCSWTFAVSATTSGCQLTLNPAALAAGSYEFKVTASDGSLSVSRNVALTLVGSKPTLSAIDTDGDGITNDVEGAVDANGNGLLDYLDALGSESPESIPLSLSANTLLMVAVADSGLKLVAGPYAIAAQSVQQSGIQIFETQVANGATPIIDSDHAAIGAIYDFEAHGLTTVDKFAHVVLPLPVVLLPNVQWRELSASGQWQDFVLRSGSGITAADIKTLSNDHLSSATRVNGQCPPPQDPAYQPGLIAGTDCVQLTVEDGGPNDADGQVNGSVSVTGAPTVPREEAVSTAPSESQSGGSTDVYVLMLLALAGLRFRRKEQV